MRWVKYLGIFYCASRRNTKKVVGNLIQPFFEKLGAFLYDQLFLEVLLVGHHKYTDIYQFCKYLLKKN